MTFLNNEELKTISNMLIYNKLTITIIIGETTKMVTKMTLFLARLRCFSLYLSAFPKFLQAYIFLIQLK